jgi:hypothetical protein
MLHVEVDKNTVVYAMDSLVFSGTVVITDPCYLLGHISTDKDLWSRLCGAWFSDDGKAMGIDGTCVVVYKGVQFLITSTKYGDGGYKVSGAGRFSVDAGLMCVVHGADLMRLGIVAPEEGIATSCDLAGRVRANDDGQFLYEGAVIVETGEGDEDDEEDWPHEARR